MAAPDVKGFLRLQDDSWLTSLRDKLAADLLANVEFTSLSFAGKTVGQRNRIATARLAEQLTEVLIDRGLAPSTYVAKPQMTVARFA